MARDVVEKLRQYGAFADRSFAGEHWIIPSDARLLLAVVEAAKAYIDVPRKMTKSESGHLVADFRPQQAALETLRDSLAHLYAGSSGESD